MITGKTESGFEYEVSENALNDWELLELLGQIQDGEMFALTKAVKRFFGEVQLARLKEHLRDDSGIIPADAVSAVFAEVMASIKDGKK